MPLRLVALMSARGAIYGVTLPFLSLLVLRAGLPPALIGPLAALAALATLAVSPLWARGADRWGRRRVLMITFGLAGPALLLLELPGIVAAAGGYLVWATLSASFVPLADSLVLDRLGGSRAAFSRVRTAARPVMSAQRSWSG